MKIYSPSYRRATGVKTHRILPQVVYCVHEFEAEEYRAEGYDVEILPDALRGNIARVRNYIKDKLIRDFGVMIDDDVEAIKAWNFDSSGMAKQTDVEDVDQLLESFKIILQESPYRLLGVNIVSDKGSYREYTPFSTVCYISGSFMMLSKSGVRFDESLPLKEDYDFTIQNCNQYRGVLRVNKYALVKNDHGNQGGCAVYRNMEKEREQMDLFKRKWGNKIVQEDRKSSKRQKNFDMNPVVRIPIKGV